MRGVAAGALAGLVALTSACGGRTNPDGAMSSGPAPGACVQVAGPLSEDATLAGAEGRYRLTMVAAGDGTSVDGSLTLVARPPGMLVQSGAETPLSGGVDISLTQVGAQPVRELLSDDPAAPGVLVLESDGTSGRSVLLRFGSESNRIDRQAVDAAFTVLDVQRIEDGGFFGVWRSGVRAERTEGYFCAWRSNA